MGAGILAYDRHGPRGVATLVLLHPISTHRGVWAPQVPILSEHFEVVTLDLPGHGDSEPDGERFDGFAQAVIKTLDHLRIGRAAIVGLSLGGMVAQAVAIARPERVSALVLTHTSAQTPPAAQPQWEQRLAIVREHGMAGLVSGTLARWFTEPYRTSSPLTMEWIATMIRSTSVLGYTHAARAIQQLDHLQSLARLSVPTLVLSGEHDAATPPATGELIARAIPGARFEVLQGAAHLGNIEQATAFTERVGGFLRSLRLGEA